MRTLCLLPLALVVLQSVSLQAADEDAKDDVKVVRELPRTEGQLSSDAWNRPPLVPMPLARLPIGSVTPRGWLRHQLELQAEGMHGRLAEISDFLQWEGNGWVNPQGTKGWEEVPYWIKGYGDLGYTLNDKKIIAEARRWIEAILATQQPDGWFGPTGLRTSLKGQPDMWAHMPVLNALQSYYEYAHDARVLKFMLNYARWQNGLPPKAFGAGYWPRLRFGDNLETVYWLYNRTGEAWLLDLARKIHENMGDWTTGVHDRHNVNIAECFREPAEYWMQAKSPRFLDAAERNYQQVMGRYGQFPGGGFAGDEVCRPGYGDPRQGFETCGIVEFMHSFEMLERISGNPLWADRCEEIAFNSLPAALTPDLKGLHYLTGANMVQLDRGDKSPGINNRGAMLSYSARRYRCCQHNHGMGWPYYAEELWLATADGGLCASLYAASEVTAAVAGGAKVRIVEETDYPFGETVSFRVSILKKPDAGAARFPLVLRVPRWCRAATVKVNGRETAARPEPLSFVVVDRTWRDGDRVTLDLPMSISVRTWAKNKDSVSVDRGPLTYSLKIGERWVRDGDKAWPDWEVFPTTPWNYGLVLDAREPARSFDVVVKPGPIALQPFTPDAAPIELHAKARKIPAWRLDSRGLIETLPQSPVKSTEPEESITLIPMGAARLRITAFPTVE